MVASKSGPVQLPVGPLLAALGSDPEFARWVEGLSHGALRLHRCPDADDLLRLLHEAEVEVLFLSDGGHGIDVARLMALLHEAAPDLIVVVAGEALSPDRQGQVLAAGAAIVADWRTPIRSLEPWLDRAIQRGSRLRAAESLGKALSSRIRAQELWMQTATRRVDELLHELRTPVGVVLGYCANLLEGLEGPVSDLQRQRLERMRAAAALMTELLGGARDRMPQPVERRTQRLPGRAEARRQVRLQELCTEVLDLVRRRAEEKQVELRLETEPDVPPVWGSRTRLAQLLINLLTNALRFTPAGGRVELRLRADGGNGEGTARTHYRLTVSDTGPGIAPDELGRIFEPGYSSQSHLGRAGLGLAVCREVAAEHGAKLWAESEPGSGTAFNLVLPGDARSRGATLSLLLVDDETLAGQLLLELQHRNGGPLPVSRPQSIEEVASRMVYAGGTLALTCLGEQPLRRVVALLDQTDDA
ncbi:MAG: HAMP domain-containing histidine kinase [Deltaproteobacteria bacterium]|nr:HAMP domain-containing histidine kinase [Deltaproteobacteria bacterium]